MEFSEPTNSKSVTNEKVGQSPNVTNDPSYYLRGHDFQSGYNYVSVEDNQTNMVEKQTKLGKMKLMQDWIKIIIEKTVHECELNNI